MYLHFANALVFVIVAILFIFGTLLFGWLVRPKNPSKEKLSTYECGMEAEGPAWIQFNIRFYIIALIFLIFDVEIAFLFPWVTLFADKSLGWLPFVEIMIFAGILFVGYIYVWVKGDLEWVRDEKKSEEEVGGGK